MTTEKLFGPLSTGSLRRCAEVGWPVRRSETLTLDACSYEVTGHLLLVLAPKNLRLQVQAKETQP